MEIRFGKVTGPGGVRNRWAVCQYCGIEVALPDSFTHHPPGSIPPEVKEIHSLLQEKDLQHLDGETLEEVKARGYSLHRDERGRLILSGQPGLDFIVWRVGEGEIWFPELMERISKSVPEGTLVLVARRKGVQRVGGPVPPEKRIRCPRCNAVAFIHEERCQWCGTWLQRRGGEEE